MQWKRIALAASALAIGTVGFSAYQQWQNTPSGKLYVADTFGDDVGVIDIASGKKIKLMKTAKLPHNFALTADKKRLYVTESGAQSVSVFDTDQDVAIAQAIVGPVPDIPEHRQIGMKRVQSASTCNACHTARPVGSFISGITFTPDEKELLITEMLTQKLTVVDAETLATKRQLTVLNPEPTTPSNVIFHPKTRDAYVLSRTHASGEKLKAHLEQMGAGGKSPHPPHAGGANPHASAPKESGFTHDARKGVSYITVYDEGLNTVKSRIRMPFATPYGAVFSPEGDELYVSYRSTNKIAVIDCKTNQHVRSYSVNEAPIGLLLAPDNETLMVANFYATPATVQFVNRRTGAIKHTLKVPSSPTLFVQHPRTKLVYMTASGSNKIAEIDPRVPEVRRILDAGAFPVDLKLVP